MAKPPAPGVRVRKWSSGAWSEVPDAVVTEEPLQLMLDGVPLSVVMRTPGEDIELALAQLPAGPTIDPALLPPLVERLRSGQGVFERTGGLHAAGLFSSGGDLICMREDIGRHNAVDKVVGRMLLDGRLPARDAILVVSGRAGYEIVQKSITAGMPLLAAVGAPSSLAVALSREFNQTLVGFLRGERFNVYAAPERLAS